MKLPLSHKQGYGTRNSIYPPHNTNKSQLFLPGSMVLARVGGKPPNQLRSTLPMSRREAGAVDVDVNLFIFPGELGYTQPIIRPLLLLAFKRPSQPTAETRARVCVGIASIFFTMESPIDSLPSLPIQHRTAHEL